MRAGRAEALAILRSWLEDRALVRIDLRFTILVAAFPARVVDVSDARLGLLSDDRAAELVLPLRPDFTFEYMDMRDFPSHSDTFDRMVAIFFPYATEPTNSIVLTEFRTP